jgi:hypothetical protein
MLGPAYSRSLASPFFREPKKNNAQIALVSFVVIAPPPCVEKTVLMISAAVTMKMREPATK